MTAHSSTRATSTRGLWVVKIGGRLCEDAVLRNGIAAAVAASAAADRPLVLVHGGGDAVTRLQRELGFAPQFVEGRRATTPEEMRVVEMVLSGSINKMIVRDLAAAGAKAAGVSGCDAGLIRCALVGRSRQGRRAAARRPRDPESAPRRRSHPRRLAGVAGAGWRPRQRERRRSGGRSCGRAEGAAAAPPLRRGGGQGRRRQCARRSRPRRWSRSSRRAR